MKEKRPHAFNTDAESDGIIEGRNAVLEALRTNTPIDKIYLAKGETDAALAHILCRYCSQGGVGQTVGGAHARHGVRP